MNFLTLKSSKRFATRQQTRKQTGLTLIELLVVILIVGIMALMAAPNYSRMVEKSRLREAMNEWQASFHYAQTEAMRIQRKVELCISENGTSCASAAVLAQGNFSVGWIVRRMDNGQILRDSLPIKKANLYLQSYDSAGRSQLPAGKIIFLGTGRIQLDGSTSAKSLSLGVNVTPDNKVLKVQDGLCLLISSEGRMKAASTQTKVGGIIEKDLCKTN